MKEPLFPEGRLGRVTPSGTSIVLSFHNEYPCCYLHGMPRKARLDAPGALHHIIVGGSSGAGYFATTVIGIILYSDYTPPRPLQKTEVDIQAIEDDIVRMLAEVTGRRPQVDSKCRNLQHSADILRRGEAILELWIKNLKSINK